MKSHEYAARLHEIADFMQSRPEFETENFGPHLFFGTYTKESFLQAVKALGSGIKEFTTGSYPELVFHPEGFKEIKVTVPRDKVCRKVQDAVWECEPILSDEDLAGVGKPKPELISGPDSNGEEIPF